MRSKELQKLTVKELLLIAKTYSITGRHSMKKDELVNSIIQCEVKVSTEVKSESPVNVKLIKIPNHTPRAKSDYVDNLKIGMIIAFKVNDVKLLSGMVEVVLENNSFKVKTKTGIKFVVNRSNIVWVKTGDRWPKGVYKILKGDLTDVF